jgi:hypothetical protein
MTDRPKRYTISVDGFVPGTYVAGSAGAARYQAWLKGAADSGYFRSFGDFISRCATLHLGPAEKPAP